MYCDGCGNQLTSGGQFCTKCGKPIVPSGVAAASATGEAAGQNARSTGAYGGPAGTYGARSGAGDGRVRGNIHRLATLWMISGILRLAGIGFMMMFGRMFFPAMRGWGGPVVWPFGGRGGGDVAFMGGPFSAGIFLGLFGAPHLLLGLGLFDGLSWEGMLGTAMGFLALRL